MSYQLKTAGIAANVRFAIFCDPDDGVIKHVTPANTTGYSGVDIGANVTTGSADWNSTSRSYWIPGSGAADADFVKFSSNKPNWTFSTASQQRSIVWILESPSTGTPTCFGNVSSSGSFALRDLGSGGTTVPTANSIGTENIIRGNGTLSGSTKYFVAMTATHGSAFKLWYGGDTGSITEASMSASPTWYTGTALNYDLDYVNRCNTYESHRQHKNWLIVVFDDDLDSTELGTLQSDWFGTLLESSGGGSIAPQAAYYRMMQGA